MKLIPRQDRNARQHRSKVAFLLKLNWKIEMENLNLLRLRRLIAKVKTIYIHDHNESGSKERRPTYMKEELWLMQI